jgi:trimeric autotransporter adhesin
MNSRFKFPRRVRIHGGECGAVARALHHEVQKDALIPYERAFLNQADLEKAFGSTFNERKQMSTKTSIKRIALVAVSVLGFGILSAAPSSALTAAQRDAAITALSVTALTTPARVGVPQSTTFKITNTAYAANETMQFSALVTQVPTGSLLTAYTGATFTNAGNAVADNVATTTGTPAAGSNVTAVGPSYVLSVSGAGRNIAINTTTVAGTINFTPDVAGTYKITIFPDNNNTSTAVASNKIATWTVVAAGAPATATISSMSSSAASCIAAVIDITNCYGALLMVQLKDAAGNATRPLGAEIVTISSNSATTLSGTQSVQLTSANVELSGYYFGQWKSTLAAGETVVFSTAGGGSLASATGLVGTTSVTFTPPTAVATGMSISDTTGTSATAIAGNFAAPTAINVSALKASVGFKVTTAAVAKAAISVRDDAGDYTGALNAVYGWSAIVTTASDGAATPTYAGTYTLTGVPALGDTVTVVAHSAAVNGVAAAQLTSAAAAISATNSDVAVTSQQALVGSSVQIIATIKDSMKQLLPNATVTFTTGALNRNASKVFTTTTNSAGVATYTLTDASTSTTNFTDVVSVNASYAGASVTLANTSTISWKSDLGVSTVTITGGNTTAGVENTVETINPINAGTSGVQASTIDMAATVKNASGAPLIGVPVTFTVAGSGAAILSTTATAYTDATGVATGKVYGWIAGKYTVTATSGGKSGTATASFGSTTNTNARVVSATVSGSLVTAKVVDRFGNPVKNVVLYATKTGAGYFGNGSSTSQGTTNAAGIVEFAIAGGDASVTVSAIDPTLAAGSTFGQTCAAADKATCGASAVAFTATTTGTSTVAETGVGASFAPAGVASATVSVTGVNTAQIAAEAASDAAAEAIDAANAATDAANLAAEAADAATVAAEEARDAADAATAAVEELATQVATLMAALKAQITTLANTVAKIAKKVKA